MGVLPGSISACIYASPLPAGTGPAAVAGTPGGSWQRPSLLPASMTLQLILPEYGQGAVSWSLASSLSLMRCISFLRAQLFVPPEFDLLYRGDGTHQSDQGGRLGPRICMGMMPLSTTYSEDVSEEAVCGLE